MEGAKVTSLKAFHLSLRSSVCDSAAPSGRMSDCMNLKTIASTAYQLTGSDVQQRLQRRPIWLHPYQILGE